MLFSVIVPVYNVAAYLTQCIESVINQSFDDFELILINDGSTDESGAICDRYKNKDERIVVVHKENGGLSTARNAGLDVAKGNYVVFVDSDDWIEQDALKHFSEAINAFNFPDVLITCLVAYYAEDKIESHDADKMALYFDKNGMVKSSVVNWEMNVSADTWPAPKRIVRRELLNDNSLRFNIGRLHEDNDWVPDLYLVARSFGYCDYPWYYHRMRREGSIGNTVRAKSITDIIEMASNQYNKFQHDESEIHKCIFDRIMISVYTSINKVKHCKAEDLQTISDVITSNNALFSVLLAPKFRYKLFAFAMRVFGPTFTLKLLYKYGD